MCHPVHWCTQINLILSLLGVNDGPECQKRTDVMDVTIRGPTRGKEGLYGKYTSLYSPVSFLNVIRSTYPVISNGVVREFRVAEGEFRDPIQ